MGFALFIAAGAAFMGCALFIGVYCRGNRTIGVIETIETIE
jgi:hypothetical protein